ncbi:MAG: hypothetical protein OXF41_20145 [bacterium]|nr:hypothetical protein [bacterium]
MDTAGGIRSARLGRVATGSGHFAVLAIDHVRSFATTVRPDNPDSLTMDDIRAAKLRLIEGLAPHAGAVLVDPGFLVSLYTTRREALSGTGVILGIEDGDYEDVTTGPRLLPGWDVQRAAGLGVDAVKISVYFDPDGDTTAGENFVADVVAQCEQAGMPLFCEPLALYDEPADRRRAVLEGVKLFGALGADVLKLQFPHSGPHPLSAHEWIDSCREIDRLSPVPWTILSEGGDYGLFREQLRTACGSGASGFLAGRAVWREAATGERTLSSGTDRLDELRAIAVTDGVAWDRRTGP